MRFIVLPLALLAASIAPARAAEAPAMPGYEIVRKHVDVDVQPNGSYLEFRDVAYKVLTAQGREALQQFNFSYSLNYQAIGIARAYTLKPDGTKIPVGQNGMLFGQGQSSRPGFSDTKTITVVFPNVEIGDQVVLDTYFKQDIPWFPGQFANDYPFSRAAVAHDVRITLTAPESLALQIDMAGLDGGKRAPTGGKNYWVWQYHNDVARRPEDNAVEEADEGPHLSISTFADFAAVAATYRNVTRNKADVTPAIQSLADTLTAGTTDRRQQARKLYDWVSGHIAYVAVVLGAGGFTPHEAGEVLARKYGDCKDHVMLLQALLKAKGIDSSPVLIDTGVSYRLPAAASPSLFDHLITYIPEFKLFADSTAQYAPFGVLPPSDAGKPVVVVATGAVATTPAITAATYRMSAISTLTFTADGTMQGKTSITGANAASVDMRAAIDAIAPDGDDEYFRSRLGPGSGGKLERGDLTDLAQDYKYSASYWQNNAAVFPGPGALTPGLSYKPFFFTYLIGGNLLPSRSQSWICPSMSAQEDETIHLPKGTTIVSLPKSAEFKAPEIHLLVKYQTLSASSFREVTTLVLDHPGPVCSAEYYNRVRPELEKMVAALRNQVIYH